jgi:hypothetical protein
LKGRWASCPAATSAPAYAPQPIARPRRPSRARGLPARHHERRCVDTGLRIEAAKALLPYFRKALD